MSKVRRVDFFPDEWLAGAFVLKADARGCYITVCALIYSNGGPIRDDARDLARLCNVSEDKWLKIRALLIEKGKMRVLPDGRLTNTRCETELEKARNRTEKARENGANGGKKSGISRQKAAFDARENNSLGEANASRETKLTTNHQPTTTNHQPEEGAEPRPGGSRYAFEGQVIRLTPDDFEGWRNAYHAIPDLTAELTSLDAYYAAQPANERKRWFQRTSGALNRKHQEHLANRPAHKPAKPRPQAKDWALP